MEGKSVRFGIPQSSQFVAATTGTSTGSVDASHDSLTAIGGLVPLLSIQLGEITPGGIGAGLYGMLMFVILGVFIAGLMVGRTPEYLGKKIEARDVKLAALAILILPLSILGLTAISVLVTPGQAGPLNPGPHGFSEILYAFSSATGNNGSAFAGLSGNTLYYNTTLEIGMWLGRYLFVIPILALAGSMVKKKVIPAERRHLPHRHAAVRGAARRRGAGGRRAHVLPRAGARPDPRALPDRRRPPSLRAGMTAVASTPTPRPGTRAAADGAAPRA